jgi:hypothetical protein
MRMMLRWSLVLALAGLMACSRDTVSRAQWEQMSQADRVLYVKSLIGAEQAKEAKGGGGRKYDRPAEEYVEQIDTAYAAGDERAVQEIFDRLEPPR